MTQRDNSRWIFDISSWNKPTVSFISQNIHSAKIIAVLLIPLWPPVECEPCLICLDPAQAHLVIWYFSVLLMCISHLPLVMNRNPDSEDNIFKHLCGSRITKSRREKTWNYAFFPPLHSERMRWKCCWETFWSGVISVYSPCRKFIGNGWWFHRFSYNCKK